MTEENTNDPGSPKTLRERAEQALRTTRTDVAAMSAEDIQRLVHELQVHQIELCMQNDELQRALTQLEETRDRYVDLYDFAPVGYLTLDTEGMILEANLTAGAILEATRQQLVGRRFALFVAVDHRDTLYHYLQELTTTGQQLSCRLAVDTPEGPPRVVHLESVARDEADEVQVRVTLSDVTQTRLLEEALEETTRRLRWADALPALLCYVDSDLRYQYCNAAHAEWFGATPDLLSGKLLRHTIAKELYDQFDDYLMDALVGREVSFEVAKSNQVGRQEIQCLFVPDKQADGAVIGLHGLSLDITASKLIERQTARRRQFEERLSRLTSDERDVYEMLVRGKANKTIAFDLDIGLRTAERRRQIVLKKLEAESLAQLLQELSQIQEIGSLDGHGTSQESQS